MTRAVACSELLPSLKKMFGSPWIGRALRLSAVDRHVDGADSVGSAQDAASGDRPGNATSPPTPQQCRSVIVEVTVAHAKAQAQLCVPV